jgi:uncharacterized protein
MNEVIAWFEIPSTDFERAVHFYSAILDSKLRTSEFMDIPHGFFEDKNGQGGGAIIHSKDATPSAAGPLIYLRVENVDDVLGRVAAAGGSVVLPKTSIGPQGMIAVIGDTEGNHVGLHAA